MTKIKNFIIENWPLSVVLPIGALILFFGIDFAAGHKLPDVYNETVVVDKDVEISASTHTDSKGDKKTSLKKTYYIYFRDIDRKEVSSSRYRKVKVGDTVKFRTWYREGLFTGFNYNGDEIIWR